MFALFLFCTLAYGHNWMQKPLSFNANKARAGNLPCNAKLPTYTTPSHEVGSSVLVEWTINHGGMHYVKVVTVADMSKIETLAKGSPELLYYFEGDKTAGKTTNVPIVASKFTVGSTYLIQYKWNNYRSCAEFKVAAKTATGTVGPTNGATVGPTLNPDSAIPGGNCNTYCEDFNRLCKSTKYTFKNNNDCLDACAQYPTTGKWKDHGGNTFQCRWYHLHPDKDHDNSAVHCPHASKVSTPDTCQGGPKFLPGANLRIKVDGRILSPTKIKEYIRDCLRKSGYNDISVSMPTQGNKEYTAKLVFSDKSASGETVEQKLKAIKFDSRPSVCMLQKPGIQSFSVADTSIDLPAGAQGSPAVVLSVVAILFCIFFQ